MTDFWPVWFLLIIVYFVMFSVLSPVVTYVFREKSVKFRSNVKMISSVLIMVPAIYMGGALFVLIGLLLQVALRVVLRKYRTSTDA